MRLEVSLEVTSPKLDCRRIWFLSPCFPRPGQEEATHGHGRGQGCGARDCTDVLLPLLPPLHTHRQALSPAQRQGGQKSKAEPFCSPGLAMTSNAEIVKEGLPMKPQSPPLKLIIRAAQITCACLETLQTHPHFTEVPTGMRWLPCCLLLQSIWNILFPLEHIMTVVSHIFCTEATSFLFLEERGDEQRLITITMPCCATAQAPEV